MMDPIDPAQCLDRKLLIVGDVNTGKTTLARRILEHFCALGLGPRIAVLDLAPHIPPELAAQRGLRGVGGVLEVPCGCDVLAIHEQLAPPRLTSTSDVEAQDKAAANKRLIDAAWPRLELGTRSVVFVNDVSMYLQAGTAAELIERIEPAATVIANGYWGERLGPGALSRHERAQMQLLRDWFERAGSVLPLRTAYPA